MSFGVDKRIEYFQRLIYLVPVVHEDSVVEKLVEEAKGKLAEALVQYVQEGTRLSNTHLLTDEARQGYTVVIQPHKVGACVVQTLHPNKKMTLIDFRRLSLPYLSNSCDFDLVESAVSTNKIVSCNKDPYEEYRDKIMIVFHGIHGNTAPPLLEMARNIIAEAGVHFAWTNENSITEKDFFEPRPCPKNHPTYDERYGYFLNIKKIDSGARMKHTMYYPGYSFHRNMLHHKIIQIFEIDFRKLIQISSIVKNFLPNEEKQIRKQISIPSKFDYYYDHLTLMANKFIFQSAQRYYRTREKSIYKKIELIEQWEHSNSMLIEKIEITPKEDGVIVNQFITDNGDAKKVQKSKTHHIDFTTLKLEGC